ncbi:MAG: anti-sigma factor [Rhizobiales bacterium]|nr:anti-sigma factor [Hyphomicrobiales bacterium]
MTPDDKALAGEYALGLLEGEAKAMAERRLAADPGFAREVEQWRARFAEFDDATAPQPAGDELWRRIEADMPRAAVAIGPSAWTRFWNNLAALRVTALGASLAALVLAVGLGFAIKAARQQPVMIAVLLDGNRAGAVVHTFADGRAVLLPLTAINVPEGKALEVWTLPSRERGPVSVGLMNQARTLRLSLKDLPALRTDQLFEITLEPATGSPTGRPTGPVLFKGNAALAL